ncbi:hypothetical protein F3C99_06215 [Vitellibacter sp. q18]|nr:hypothetical protein [Aequorivita lutea]
MKSLKITFKVILNLSVFVLPFFLQAQVGIGNIAPDPSSILDITSTGTVGASGYIRNASNHNNSSINFSEVVQLNANDVLTLSSIRSASNGSVTLRSAGSSNIYIEKKS